MSAGKPPTIAVVAVLLLLGVGGIVAVELLSDSPSDIRDKQKSDHELLQRALERNRKAAIVEKCAAGQADLFKRFESAMRSKKYGTAALTLEECVSAGAGPNFSTKWNEANRLSNISIASDRAMSPALRIAAITKLSLNYPGDAAPFQSVLPTLQIQAAKDEQRVKKAQGVSLGMSPAEALASSWGKPERKNRSISAGSVREQWVYPDGQYLYFVNDVLTRIDTAAN